LDDVCTNEDVRRAQLHDDPDCCNNLSRSLRVVKTDDVRIDPNEDGYTYWFVSPADGPVLSRMALQQILVLLHIVHSFIPEKCVIETEYLKPTFDKGSSSSSFSESGGMAGLEKLERKIPMTEDEAREYEEIRQKLNAMPVSEMPFETPFIADTEGGGSDGCAGGMGSDDDVFAAYERVRRSMMTGQKCRMQIVDVAEILVVPVCVTYVLDDDESCTDQQQGGEAASRKRQRARESLSRHGGMSLSLDGGDDAWGFLDVGGILSMDHAGDAGKEKISGFWAVVLKTKKCYNFSSHVHWLVSNVDREDRSNMKNIVKREYEDVMTMLREVVLYQYEQSPNAVAFFRMQGVGTRIDPLARLTQMCTPDSLDHVCSPFEAYRSMVFHVQNEDPRRRIVHVTGFSETMLFTTGMLEKSLSAQKTWHEAFAQEKSRVAQRKEEMSKAMRIKDDAEREARVAELDRAKETEGLAHLPPPVLYPIYRRKPASDVRKPSSGGGGGGQHSSAPLDGDEDSLMYDEYTESCGTDGRRKGTESDDNLCGDDDDDDDAQIDTGIPEFPLVMRVDIQGKFGKEKTLHAFQAKFGSLPAAAMQQVTEMMYNTSGRNRYTGRKRVGMDSVDVRTVQLARDIFLPDPKIMQPYTRLKAFKPDEFTMEGFKMAGCDMHLLDRIMKVVRNTKDGPDKIQLFDDYVRRITRQHISSVLNNDLRSNHALYTARYLEQGKGTSCRDLRSLIGSVAPSFYRFVYEDRVMSRIMGRKMHAVRGEAYALEAVSPAYWHLNCPSTFVCYSWLMDDLLRFHNEKFFHLTAQNLRICNDAWVGMIHFRLGQHEDWCYMGAPTVICDAGCKLRKAATGFASSGVDSEGVVISSKRPSAGLDLIKDALNKRRTSVRKYVKTGQNLQSNDAQEMVQLRRATAAGMHIGYVLFVNGEVEKVPDNELAMDCVLPEGPPDNFEAMASLFNNIPRDQGHDAELWNTADKKNNNIRDKLVYKLLAGYQMYLCLMGKNYIFEKKTESRYMDMLIVCNVQESNGPMDKDGLRYMAASAAGPAARTQRGARGDSPVTLQGIIESMEDGMDAGVQRKGVVRTSNSSKCRNKGPRPSDKDQQMWAPMHYFVHSVAGTVIAMMHKLGMISLEIDYGVASVSRYLYDYAVSTLGCLMDSNDETYAGRYFDCYKTRSGPCCYASSAPMHVM
jgi:hypothetical protein